MPTPTFRLHDLEGPAAGAPPLPGLDAETDRLASLRGSGLLDSPPEEDFDRIVELASAICGAPMALVSLIDADRQWFKARVGVGVSETPRAESFCQFAIDGPGDLMEVPDARLDARFSALPSVTAEPHVRMYAGAVVRDREGRGLGTLCVLDRRARRLTPAQRSALVTLGRQVAALIELRRGAAELAHARTALGVVAGSGVRRAVITLDPEWRILGWSGDAERLYGYGSDAVVGRVLTDVLRSETEAPADVGDWQGDVTHHRRDGSPVRVRTRIEVRRDTWGEPVGYLVINEDLTSADIERLCHETYAEVVIRLADGASLEELADTLCRVVDGALPGAHASLMAVDAERQTLDLVAAPGLSARLVAALVDVPVRDGVGSCGTAAFQRRPVMSDDLRNDPAWSEYRELLRAESLQACWSYPVIGPSRAVLGTFGVYWDQPHRPDADELQLIATLASLTAIVFTARSDEMGGDRPDGLTGLLSRDGLDRALRRMAPERGIGVVALGIDRFELVNRQFGLETGDGALRQIAARLVAIGLPVAVVARFASDQFVVVVDEPWTGGQGQDARWLAEQLVVAMREPFEVGGTELWLTASSGVATGRAGGGQDVLHAAVAAARRARHLGGDRCVDAHLPGRGLPVSSLELVGALHRAVAAGALDVHYQPKVALPGGTIEGFEALARWTRVDGTSVPPSEFITLAEEIGLIATVGEQVLRRACADAVAWPVGPGGRPLGVAVNVSGRELVPGRLVATVASVLADTGLDPGRLTLEVTETALADDLEAAITALREVHDRGVRIAIDDFGIGYSSLGHLSRFPIDELKIDRSFVERMEVDPAVDAIVRSVVALSHSLGLRCVAEGVETAAQLRRLTRLGCDAFQGHICSPAVADPLVTALVERGWTARG